jgi:hypothetical protein
MNEISRMYVLDSDRNVINTHDAELAAKFFNDHANRRVGLDHVGGLRVSTVFLGFDHAVPGKKPQFFETMIFGDYTDSPDQDLFTRRYSTWDEAKQGHDVIVNELRDPDGVIRFVQTGELAGKWK